jgi:tryptophanyl-tRNA synthetase
VLSGITATGRLHLGHYIGAVRGWVADQDEYENYFFIADLHAITDPELVVAAELRERIREIAALYLACGLDPARSVLFRQSQVPAHTTLAWVLDCVTPVGWLERMTQYKTRSAQTGPSAGLLTYPALMAADILLYRAAYVPVGDDQRQHVELARDIAHRFNRLFGDTFTVPAALIRATGARIMALDDPTTKMSKSVAQLRDGHAIALLDGRDKVRRAVMRAVTDAAPVLDPAALSPGVDNLLVLFEALSGSSRAAALEQFAGRGYGYLKNAVADLAIDCTATVQARYAEVRKDDRYLDDILATGAQEATTVATPTLRSALHAVGLD